MKQTSKGFTLVELAIVLVIIGLLVTGVLVGKDLIDVAKINKVVSDIKSYDAALMMFRDKFNAVPGDFCRASQFLGAGAINGNGNNRFDNGVGCGVAGFGTSHYDELHVFAHLSKANFIKQGYQEGPYTAYSQVNLSDVYPAANLPGSNKAHIVLRTMYSGWTGSFSYVDNGVTQTYNSPTGIFFMVDITSGLGLAIGGGILPKHARMIDEKLDDGKLLTGATKIYANSACIVSPATNTYREASNDFTCLLLIKNSVTDELSI